MDRSILHRQLAPEAWHQPGLSPLNKLICILILLASLVAILETEPNVRRLIPGVLSFLEVVFVSLFILEYLLRLYVAGEDPRYRGIGGRIRYVFSIWALIDLVAILPFFLGFLTHSNAFLLRLLRILRILRLSRLGRFSRAWSALAEALNARVHELLLSVGVAALLLLFSSACLYVVEAAEQPEAFGSVPRALWWSIATLTTVGYGDVTPITALGKIFAGMTAIAGIGIIAMPTGILAAAFSDAFQNNDNTQGE
ncbi:voltage-gated potassium channel [Halomonas campaniensis]|uniref:Voltage-gated potassium channel n=1 Tax=Halomonas campaniensis TaxID=213554 RepID=A0A7W5K2M2_9GAMM|nr:ion transporter [Halomonas campaniensis]MBB3330716.1 voltage-gated potassium channel [Halomonas campaniensis]